MKKIIYTQSRQGHGNDLNETFLESIWLVVKLTAVSASGKSGDDNLFWQKKYRRQLNETFITKTQNNQVKNFAIFFLSSV